MKQTYFYVGGLGYPIIPDNIFRLRVTEKTGQDPVAAQQKRNRWGGIFSLGTLVASVLGCITAIMFLLQPAPALKPLVVQPQHLRWILTPVTIVVFWFVFYLAPRKIRIYESHFQLEELLRGLSAHLKVDIAFLTRLRPADATMLQQLVETRLTNLAELLEAYQALRDSNPEKRDLVIHAHNKFVSAFDAFKAAQLIDAERGYRPYFRTYVPPKPNPQA